MSNTEIKSIVDALMSDPSVKSTLESAASEEEFIQGLVAAAADRGHTVAPAALRDALLQPVGASELSDRDLEAVAGGTFMERWYYERFTSGYRKC